MDTSIQDTYRVMWGFLRILLTCLVICFSIGGRAGASLPVTIIGQKVDFCTKIAKTQAASTESPRNCFSPVVFSSFRATEVKLTRGDDGKEISIKIGNVLQIELERSGGTGYDWYLDKSYKKCFKLLREDTETRQVQGLVGTPVVKTWELRAIKRGETEIRLHLYREWEGKDQAVETFKIRVRTV